MSLYIRGNVWWVKMYFGGKVLRFSTRTTNRDIALYLMALKKLQIHNINTSLIAPNPPQLLYSPSPLPLPQSPINSSYNQSYDVITFPILFKQWTKYTKKKSINDDLGKQPVIEGFFGSTTDITSITSEQVEDFATFLYNKGLANGTVNHYIRLCRSMYNMLIKKNTITYNPFKAYRMVQSDNTRERYITKEEFNLLFTAATGDLKTATIIGYYTGMRLSEVLRLSWTTINLNANEIKVLESKNGCKRDIPIVKPLKAYLETITNKPLFSREPSLNFTNKTCRDFKNLAIDLELGESTTFHCLRHTCITNMFDAGMDVLEVKAISGHKTLQILDRYRKNIKSLKNKSAGKLNNYFA